MTTPQEMRDGLAGLSLALANAVTGAAASADPYTTLVGSLDQIRGFAASMAAAVTDTPLLLCSGCIQDARNRESTGETPLPIHPARTVVNGLAVCDVEGRHRIVTAVQHATAQSGRLLLPGQVQPAGLPNGRG